jgi:pimeloyl-ACP methyl ester carboxylesterase
MNVDFVQAAKSDRWTPEILSELKTIVHDSKKTEQGSKGGGEVKLHVLPNAGHWLHMDNPQGLVAMLAPSLQELAQEVDVT